MSSGVPASALVSRLTSLPLPQLISVFGWRTSAWDAPFREATLDVIVVRMRRLPHVGRSFADMLIAEIGAAP